MAANTKTRSWMGVWLAVVGGASLGTVAGSQSPAQATSCGCAGDELQLTFVSGPDVPCAESAGDCDSEWLQDAAIYKYNGGITADILQSGIVYLDRPVQGD